MADSLVETPASSSSHLINLGGGMNQLPVDLQAGSSSGASSSAASLVVAASSSSSSPAPSSSSSGGQTSTLLISVATQPQQTHGLNLSEQIMTAGQEQQQQQLNLSLQQPPPQVEIKESKTDRSADRSGEDEPEAKRKKIDKPSTKMIEKLEARLGGILCCAVCLDLPRTAMYQVNLSIHHLFLPISQPPLLSKICTLLQ